MEILNLFWGFILTIWNVKMIEGETDPDTILGFILTIWNVK
ncbi:hypothetical protein QO7_2152 [Clostridioides difficile F314]|nr:hypothetical protein QO7_2152 [Clostridioides difficile F314]